MKKRLKLLGTNVLIKEIEIEKFGINLRDMSTLAIVQSIGTDVTEVQVGDTVGLSLNEGIPYEDMRIVDESAILVKHFDQTCR